MDGVGGIGLEYGLRPSASADRLGEGVDRQVRERSDIRVAVDRDQVAELGFDYRYSYPAFDITDSLRNTLMRPLRVSGDTEPFIRFLTLHNIRN